MNLLQEGKLINSIIRAEKSGLYGASPAQETKKKNLSRDANSQRR